MTPQQENELQELYAPVQRLTKQVNATPLNTPEFVQFLTQLRDARLKFQARRRELAGAAE